MGEKPKTVLFYKKTLKQQVNSGNWFACYYDINQFFKQLKEEDEINRKI